MGPSGIQFKFKGQFYTAPLAMTSCCSLCCHASNGSAIVQAMNLHMAARTEVPDSFLGAPSYRPQVPYPHPFPVWAAGLLMSQVFLVSVASGSAGSNSQHPTC